jgi:hypothetical protein
MSAQPHLAAADEIEFTEEPASIDAWEVDELDRDSELESVAWARQRDDD